MGPGCGTAMLGEVGLGFANVVRSGPGRHRRRGRHRRAGGRDACSTAPSVGVSQIVGVGGRDLSDGGRRDHVRRGDADARRRRRDRHAAAGLQAAGARGRPAARRRSTSAASAWSPRSSAGKAATRRSRSTRRSTRARSRPRASRRRTSPTSRRGRRAPRGGTLLGLYSGGSLAHEAVTILEPRSARSAATPARRRRRPRDLRPRRGGVHAGPPAPDGRPRGAAGDAAATSDDGVGCVLLDVVIGHGSHADPAGGLAEALAALARDRAR